MEDWCALVGDADALFDREEVIDATTQVAPTITWGISPDQVLRMGAVVPEPGQAPDAVRRARTWPVRQWRLR